MYLRFYYHNEFELKESANPRYLAECIRDFTAMLMMGGRPYLWIAEQVEKIRDCLILNNEDEKSMLECGLNSLYHYPLEDRSSDYDEPQVYIKENDKDIETHMEVYNNDRFCNRYEGCVCLIKKNEN